MTSHAFATSSLAVAQGGVVSLDQLRFHRVTRGQIRAQVEARRWRRVHSLVLAMHTGPLSEQGTWWAAVLEGGPRAHLDGVSALLAEGLTGFTTSVVRVSVPPGSRARRAEGWTSGGRVAMTRRPSYAGVCPAYALMSPQSTPHSGR